MEKLDTLARWLIVSSILYYELDSPVSNDHVYDSNARQFVELAKANPDAKQAMRWLYMMDDFDCSTGFHLYHRLKKKDKEQLMRQAELLLKGVRNGVQ